MSRLLYIVNQRIPTEKAYGIQITKMCEAFADTGLDVTLVAPRRGKGITADIFDYYSVRRNFKVKYANSPDFYWPGKLDFLAFWIKNFFSAWILAKYAAKTGADIIYSRDELPLFFVLFLRPSSKIVFEAHKFSGRKKIFYSWFKKLSVKIVTITNGLANEFLKLGFAPDSVKVAADGFDSKLLETADVPKDEARTALGLPQKSPLAVYTGGLYSWKGVYTLADAAKILSAVNFIVVGGGQGEKEFSGYLAKRGIKNLRVTGHIRNEEILRFYRSAADVLVLPNTAKDKLSARYTSPLKLFEYMASRRPIVASDLPSIREILDENNSILVEADNPALLAEGIKTVLGNPSLGDQLSHFAFEGAKKYTWQKRASEIIHFMTL